MITVSGLTKAYGARVLFRDVTFQLSDGRRIALVGGNGAGKTTLLEIVLGTTEADAGEVHRPKDQTIGYLPQEITEWGSGSVLDEVLAGRPEIQHLEQRLTVLHDEIATTDGEAHDRALAAYGEAQSRFESLGGYAVEASAHRVLAGLGFAAGDAKRPLTDMSGGWRMRAALGRLLLAQPEVLILDEPTNHLDTDSVTWLEDTLSSYPGAILFVSHDRDFIDAVAERVVELVGGTATEYVGGFAEFVVQREERLASVRALATRQAKEIAHVERFVERFRYKATKARQVQSRVKTLEKLERIEVPDHRAKVARFGFPPPRRSSRLVAELADVTVGYDGTPVLSDVSFALERGEKLALVGPNGAGKTTLLRLLLGDLQPMTGTCTIGANVDMAYFAQHQVEALDLERTALQELQTAAGTAHKDRNLRTVLGSFGLSGEAADRKVAALSGGERTRLALAKTMINPVNLLVLDEPTNHLDLPSCDVLEDALDAYPGSIVLVTHDRYLIREVATSLVAVRDGRARLYAGVDEAVLSPHAGPAPTMPTPVAQATISPGRAKADGKRTAAEVRQARSAATRDLKKKVERLERDLGRAETTVADLHRQLADPDLYQDNERVKLLVAAHDEAKDRAGSLMDQWLEAQGALDRAEARFA
jgi:ATP-binding cassette subfamily F protein 3